MRRHGVPPGHVARPTFMSATPSPVVSKLHRQHATAPAPCQSDTVGQQGQLHDLYLHGMVRYGIVWYGMVLYGRVW